MSDGGYCPRCKAATYGEHECPKPEAARDKEFFLEIIESWTHYWMNQTQNSEADRANYFRRAFGVDANMRHHLAMKMHVAFEQMRKERDEFAAQCEVSGKCIAMLQEELDNKRGAMLQEIYRIGKERDRWKDLEKIARFDVENRIAMLSCERDTLLIAVVEHKAEIERLEGKLLEITQDWEHVKIKPCGNPSDSEIAGERE